MMSRPAPRRAALAVQALLDQSTPASPLAAVQTVWRQVVGESIAAVAEPIGERNGVLTVRCESATWAQELSLMEGELLRRLEERLGERSPGSLKLLAG